DRLRPVELARFHNFDGGVALDAEGNAYVSHGSVISKISPDGKRTLWAETGAPSGHKILPDGTHLVCDASRSDVLRLDAQGKILGSAILSPDSKHLKSPNDLAIDPAGGFYFTDSGGMHGDAPGSI